MQKGGLLHSLCLAENIFIFYYNDEMETDFYIFFLILMPISEIRKELEVIIRGDDVENVEGYMEAQCSWREFSCVFICDCSISSDIILFNYKEK